LPSFDPQSVIFVPVFDRQFGIAVEAVVIGADLRFDPARFVAQKQMHARWRLWQLRVDCRGADQAHADLLSRQAELLGKPHRLAAAVSEQLGGLGLGDADDASL